MVTHTILRNRKFIDSSFLAVPGDVAAARPKGGIR
jgi:hypothetical protein